MEKPRILSIGFEGPSRVGKGTQIELFKKKLDELGIPCLAVRGDGSRPNEGRHLGDPVSEWWESMLLKLRSKAADYEDWAESSYRLARELIVFRDRVLPRIAKGMPFAFLLIDRSILSRTMIPRERKPENIVEQLYPEEARRRGRKITVQKVCPDLIINLSADLDTLLARLDREDPKYEFRKELIIKRYAWYKDAIEFIPEELRGRVVQVDSKKTIEDVHDEICRVVGERFPRIEHLFKKQNQR
jgi:thymidylate kinase